MNNIKPNFSEPTIVTNEILKHRSYISFNYHGKPKREYNGKSIGIDISPNRARSLSEKATLLKRLQFEFLKALDTNCYPNAMIAKDKYKNVDAAEKHTTEAVIRLALQTKLKASLADKYKRNLIKIQDQLLSFLTDSEKKSAVNSLTSKRLNQFLSQFNSTGTYYMNKR